MNRVKVWLLLSASVVSAIFLLASCGEKVPSPDACENTFSDGIVVFRCTGSNVMDDIVEGAKEYAVQNNVRFLTVTPSSSEKEQIEKEISRKILDGYTTVVATGAEYITVIEDVSEAFPTARFYIFDTYIFEERDNVTSVFCDNYDAGYISGYIMAESGMYDVGFFGAVPQDDETLKNRDGLIAGLTYAAEKSDLSVSVTIAFANSFVPREETLSAAAALYDEGCVCVLGSGPGTWEALDDACKTRDTSFCQIAYVPDSDSRDFSIVFDHKTATYRLLCKYFGRDNVPDTVFLGVKDEVFKASASDLFSDRCSEVIGEFERGELTIERTLRDSDNVTIYEYNWFNN